MIPKPKTPAKQSKSPAKPDTFLRLMNCVLAVCLLFSAWETVNGARQTQRIVAVLEEQRKAIDELDTALGMTSADRDQLRYQCKASEASTTPGRYAVRYALEGEYANARTPNRATIQAACPRCQGW